MYVTLLFVEMYILYEVKVGSNPELKKTISGVSHCSVQ